MGTAPIKVLHAFIEAAFFSLCLFSFLHSLGSLCDRFYSSRHLGSHIPSSGVQVHADYFRVSIIHQTRTWTTGSLTCVHGLLYACVYTRGGLGTPTASQHNLSDSEKLSFSFAPDGVRTSGHGISSPTIDPRPLDLPSNALTTETARHPFQVAEGKTSP